MEFLQEVRADVRADGAGLEGNIRDAMYRQAGGHFQPEAGVAGMGRNPLDTEPA